MFWNAYGRFGHRFYISSLNYLKLIKGNGWSLEYLRFHSPLIWLYNLLIKCPILSMLIQIS